MRNDEFLDNKQPVDDLIGELKFDKKGNGYRIIKGKKIYQFEEKTQEEIDKNLIMNRIRASGLTPGEYLKSVYRNRHN